MHGHHDHHGHAHGSVKKAKLAAAIALNLIITAAEFAGGIISGSLALMSDAGHNLSDVLSLILGFAGEKVSERTPSQQYSFGMKRFEVFVAFMNAVALVAIGIYILYESAARFMTPAGIDIGVMLPVACVGLAGNLLSILVLFRNRKDNLNMKASYLHLFYDTVSSFAVVVAALIITATGLYWIDIIVSIAIVIMIFISSSSIIRQSLRIILQGTPSSINPDEVNSAILSVDSVADVHGLHIWSVSSTEVFLSAHICLADGSNPAINDSVIRHINESLEKNFGIRHTAIQIEQSPLCSFTSGDCCR